MIRTIRLRNILLLLIACACSATTVESQDRTKHAGSSLAHQIDRILSDTLLESSFVGVYVVSLDNGSVLYDRFSSKLFHPASNMKLITSAVGLQLLGPDFRFKTAAYHDGAIENDTVDGNLVIKGFGDPVFSLANLDSLVRLIREAGIRHVRGDLVGDVSYFDSTYWGAGWMWDDEPEIYEAFISPLTINKNSIDVTVRPGITNGDPVQVVLQPATDYVTVVNTAITSSDASIRPLSVDRRKGQNVITVEGRIDPASASYTKSFSVWKPEYFFLDLLSSRLLFGGITVAGRHRLGSADSAHIIAEFTTPIDTILYHINKNSYNLGAENLLRVLGAEKFGIAGSDSAGLRAVKAYLASVSIDTTRLRLADGSGVSFYNLVSPKMLVQLLQDQYNRSSTFARFYRNLAIAGVDGTMRNRLRNSRAAGKAHAKTGDIGGVNSLTGYVTAADGTMLAFSILCNHFPGESRYLREVQDRIVEVLANSRSAQR
jgi:D-alanyl-D-alanine carboxypeptidase/D-alanyl-D-alanine-endopeptidase (penicillin-binding protein 4)